MRAFVHTLCACALAGVAGPGLGQSLHYVEPGVAACGPAPAPDKEPFRAVKPGAAVAGSLRVACGFGEGSYTVTLNASDPAAAFSPRTFLVNFGRLSGPGTFTVTFATAGEHHITATITSNMGSPPVRGHFVGAGTRFVVAPS